MKIEVKDIGEDRQVTIMEMDGVIDSTNLEEFFKKVSMVFKGGAINIIMDLSHTSYISSGGLSVITDAFKKAGDRGGKLVISCASESVRELFRVIRFDRVIEFYQDLDSAIKSFA